MQRIMEKFSSNIFDVIVIGGGITGAAVAYEAATRGFSVALLEKGDFGAATSAATSKLIHGGLRYLANFEFGLVRESLKERRILENIAPSLVYPLPFLVPLYNHSGRNKLVIEPGMILYDLLSYDKGFTWDPSKKIPLHRLIGRQSVMAEEPVVNPAGLTGGVLYYDCASISPERLTLAFVKSAVKHGTVAANYTRVEDFVRQGDAVTGVIARDTLSGSTLTINGRLTINCAGPWADLVLDRARGKPGEQHVRRSEGIHIVTRGLTKSYAVGGLTASGRACNLIPWRGHTLIGTTDQAYSGDPDHYAVTREKIQAFLDEVNEAFGDPNLVRYEDVLYAYGGLRPLVEDQTKDVYRTSRRYEIYDNAKDGLPGFITVEGGKYTTSRNLAENVVKLVCKKFGKAYTRSRTASAYLAGCEVRDINAHVAAAKAANRYMNEAHVDYLARLYGSEFNALMAIASSDVCYRAPLNADGETIAQVVYAVRSEMALTLPDILLRRTGLGTLGYPGAQALQQIGEVVAAELQWDTARLERELVAAETATRVPA